ncbi:MAG: hypothetical protein ACM3UZ_06210 [Acidobacteriota bacterium]
MEMVFTKTGFLYVGKVKDLQKTLTKLSMHNSIKELIHSRLN